MSLRHDKRERGIKTMWNEVVPAVAINGTIYNIDSLTKRGNLSSELYRPITSFFPYDEIPVIDDMEYPAGQSVVFVRVDGVDVVVSGFDVLAWAKMKSRGFVYSRQVRNLPKSISRHDLSSIHDIEMRAYTRRGSVTYEKVPFRKSVREVTRPMETVKVITRPSGGFISRISDKLRRAFGELRK